MPGTALPVALREHFVAFARAYRDTPMLTAYIAGGMRDPADRRHWKVVLKRNLSQLARAHASAPRDERDALDAAAAALMEAVPADGVVHATPGFVVFATARGDTLMRTLDAPPDASASWQPGPRIAPALVAGTLPSAIVAIADRKHATIHRMSGGTLIQLEQIAVEVDLEPNPRMGAAPRRGFHTGTRGGTQQDATARRLREALERHVGHLAARIASFAEPDALIVLGGVAETLRLVSDALPPTLRARVARATGLRAGAGERAIVEAAERALREAEATRQVEFAHGLLDAVGTTGNAAAGLADVVRALERRAVDALLVSQRLVMRHAAALEQMVREGLAEGATVAVALPSASTLLDAEAGGVVARLRFAVPTTRRAPRRRGPRRKAAATSA
ncbi:MAG: hypothetical protein U9Q74_16500 [Gemmatimonadota bacterium]|nr:hypothetical protein [Gemmatimonadota bacterium]